jgi:osmotically-inducible protein OsmY
MSKTDKQLQQDVEGELRWDPKINAAQIGVSVEKGTVSLLGTVDTYAEKLAAEQAAGRVGGVHSVLQDLSVKVLEEYKRNDTEMEATIQHAFKWYTSIPDSVTSTVRNGTVTLGGHVSWNYQREAAEDAARYLIGVVSVDNHITIKPEPSATQVKEKIMAALQRQATTDASSIKVEMSEGRVTLTGHAASRQSINNATNAAWAAPGVTEVLDELTVTAVSAT